MTNYHLLCSAKEELRLAVVCLTAAQKSRAHETTCVCLDAFHSHMADARSFVERVVHNLGSPAAPEAVDPPALIPRDAEIGKAGEPTLEKLA